MIDSSADALPHRSGCAPGLQIHGRPWDKGAGTGERATNGCEFVLLLQSGKRPSVGAAYFPCHFSVRRILFMCGIVGYVGHEEAAPILLEGQIGRASCRERV